MNLLDSLFDLGKSAIDKIWPDPIKRAEEVRKLEELRQKGDLAELQATVSLLQGQMQINLKEADHKSLFVAGWRPAVGWTCVVAFFYMSVLEPLMRFIATLSGYVGGFPALNTDITLQVLLGMLGLGAMRSFDKRAKVETNSIK